MTMKVLHINNKYQGGGAARAMGRLHQQLIRKGHQSRFLVGRSQGTDLPGVQQVSQAVEPYKKIWESGQSRIGNLFQEHWGLHPWAYKPSRHIPETELFQWADLIDLRNVFGDYFNLWTLQDMSARKPVVWRLPDMWALTGHCAYPYQCPRWVTGCHHCPLLTEKGRKWVEPAPTTWDGTRRSWRAKQHIYQNSRLHIVVTTRWMRDNVKQGILSDAQSVSVISNGVDLDIYQPGEKAAAREALNLPQERKIALFAAANLDNLRKGYRFAREALGSLQREDPEAPLLVTMGAPRSYAEDHDPDSVRHLGFIREAQVQAQIFAAADVFLCPTLADAQPQTALESIACGTPVIAFPVGPMSEIVLPGKTGFLARDISVPAFTAAVKKAFQAPDRLSRMTGSCRHQADISYDLGRQTDQYVDLYQRILTG
jgi:glycosyltransferase involved in cell wall biosynthesis